MKRWVRWILIIMLSIVVIAVSWIGVKFFFYENGLQLGDFTGRYEKDLHLDDNAQPVVVYSRDFAKRVGLDPRKAITLDPGIEAASFVFKKDYTFGFMPMNSFYQHHHIDGLNDTELETFESNVQVLPILFKQEPMPVFIDYDCYLNLYLKSDDPRLKAAQLPSLIRANNDDYYDIYQKMLKLLDLKRVTPLTVAVDDTPETIKAIKAADMKYDLGDDLDVHFGAAIPNAVQASSRWAFNHNQFNPTDYVMYVKNFMPNVSFLSFNMLCTLIPNNSGRDGSWIWLQKVEPASNAQVMSENPKDYVRYRLPPQLTNAPSLQRVIRQESAVATDAALNWAMEH